MFKHLMARLLNIGILTGAILSCNVIVSVAAPTSGVENSIIINEQTNTQEKKEELKITPKTIKKKKNVIKFNKVGYLKADIKVRKKPTKKSKVLKKLSFNKRIKYAKHNSKWVKIKNKKKVAYICKEYISKKKIKYRIYSVPHYNGYKSWMPYTAITSPGSPQYKLQYLYGYTGNYGIRMAKGRYCVAIGYHFKASIGQYFDLILANGTVIKCIKGDEKAICDTDSRNIFSRNGCATEFLISRSALARSIRRSGDTSSACKKWHSRVAKIKIYKKNIFKQ